MLVLLLIVTRVAGEWVEISQYQRREDPARRASMVYRGVPGPNKIYANHSLTEYQWHMSGVSRAPNIGTVRRVQLQGKEKPTLSVGGGAESTLVKATTVDREYEIGPVRAPNRKILKDNFETDFVKRKSNVDYSGTINEPKNQFYNRAQYSDLNNEMSSKSTNVLNTNTQVAENKYQEIKINDEDGNAAETNYEPVEVKPNVRNDYINGTLKKDKLYKETQVKIKENWKENEHKGGRFRSGDVTRTNKTLYEHNDAPPQNPYSLNAFKQNNRHNFDSNVDKKINTVSPQGEQVRREDVNVDGDTKTNTVQVLWKLMKIVTDNISRNTRRSFRSKVKYLEGLRNDIIANIAERLEQAWPDDTGAEAGRARSRRSEAARGHVEFPSSESALMTISFLTFAVFLIKLVLQVIHTYKNKTMMVTPAVVAAVGRAAASFKQKIVP